MRLSCGIYLEIGINKKSVNSRFFRLDAKDFYSTVPNLSNGLPILVVPISSIPHLSQTGNLTPAWEGEGRARGLNSFCSMLDLQKTRV
jgi:hypothetical protein